MANHRSFRTFGSRNSFRNANFVTAGISCKSTSALKLFQNESHFSNVPSYFVMTSLGNLTLFPVDFSGLSANCISTFFSNFSSSSNFRTISISSFFSFAFYALTAASSRQCAIMVTLSSASSMLSSTSCLHFCISSTVSPPDVLVYPPHWLFGRGLPCVAQSFPDYLSLRCPSFYCW